MAKRLAETNYLSGSATAHKIDREAGIIRGVRVIGFESANKRRYPKPVLEAAVAKYEGADVNLDHKVDSADRSIGEAWGTLTAVTVREDGVYADLPYLKTHPQTPMLLEMAERFPRNFGLSHVVEAEFDRDKEGWANVTKIHAVESVDVVRRPATNAGLFESRSGRSRRKIKDVLATLEGKHDGAKSLAKLLEDDMFADLQDTPVTVPAEGETEDPAAALKDGVAELVQAIIDQDIQAADKLARIKKVLDAGEAPASPEPTQPGGSEGNDMTTAADPAKKQAAPAVDPNADAANKLAALERKLAIRDAYDEAGLMPSQLTEAQRKLIDAQADAANVKALLAEFKSTVKPAETVSESQDKPVVRRAVTPANPIGATKYDDLLTEARRSTGARMRETAGAR